MGATLMNESVDFWDLAGWFLSTFILIAYLMVLFSIFRDRKSVV